MTQVIVFSNDLGGVSLCVPTGEIPIEAVKAKDTPEGSIIVDKNTLPENQRWFNAWELNGSTVTVNLNKAKIIATNEENNQAAEQYLIRQRNTALGIPNEPSDEVWLQMVEAKRTAIANATSIAELDVL